MTPKLTKKQKDHIDARGEQFTNALARATMCVRSCNKLIGMDKIRAPIAWRAALAATGYPFETNGFVLDPKQVGPVDQEIQDIAAELYDQAAKAARS